MKEIILTPEENVIAEALNVYINNVDIPDLPAPAAPAAMVAASVSNEISDVPVGLAIFDLLLQIAACAGICFLSYLLYTDLQTKWF